MALLNDDDVNRNILEYLIQEIHEELLHDFRIQRRGIREKNRNYYEQIIPLYNNLVFKEHFRMSIRSIEVCVNLSARKSKIAR